MTNDLTLIETLLPVPHGSVLAMTPAAIETVRRLEVITLSMEQVPIVTDHLIHGGMYARTIMIPAGTLITGVLVKVPTTLIIQGDVQVYLGDDTLDLTGYNVLPASAVRKQAFHARTDTYLTMMCATAAPDVEAAEHFFTDDFDQLASHRDPEINRTRITGE